MKKGFTLIELLVVISIIAILAAVILVSLSTATGKSTAAKIKAEMVSAQADGELYYDEKRSTFIGVCDYLLSKYKHDDGSWFCEEDENSFRIAANLSIAGSGVASIFCVDSTGFKDDLTGTPPDSPKICKTP